MDKRYQRGNQNPYIEDEQKTQWTKDTKRVRILITPLVFFVHCVVCSSSIYGFWLPLWYLLSIVLSVRTDNTMDKRYQRGNQNLYIEDEQTTQWTKDTKRVIILITLLVSFVHCVFCSSSIYGFWLPLWYLLSIVLSVRLRYTDSDYPFGIFCPLCCLFVFDIRILITPLVSFVPKG
jgi:flagellar basal body-associated protein FliL